MNPPSGSAPSRARGSSRSEHGRDARRAATLRRHGFRVDDLESDGEGRVEVQFHRVDHCAGGRIDEVSQEILDIVLAEDGEYDGWGAALVEAVEVEKPAIKPMPGPETE